MSKEYSDIVSLLFFWVSKMRIVWSIMSITNGFQLMISAWLWLGWLFIIFWSAISIINSLTFFMEMCQGPWLKGKMSFKERVYQTFDLIAEVFTMQDSYFFILDK